MAPQLDVTPPDFDVYGLVGASWVGHRELDWFNYYSLGHGQPQHCFGVWLGHRDEEVRTRGVIVGTVSTAAYKQWKLFSDTPPRPSPESHVALVSLGFLIDFWRPIPEVAGELPTGDEQSFRAEVERICRGVDQWLHLEGWELDGELATPRIYMFAGGWVGITPTRRDSNVWVAALGTDPSLLPNLTLSRAISPAVYGYEPGAILRKDRFLAKGRDWIASCISRPSPLDYDSDFELLANKQSPSSSPEENA